MSEACLTLLEIVVYYHHYYFLFAVVKIQRAKKKLQSKVEMGRGPVILLQLFIYFKLPTNRKLWTSDIEDFTMLTAAMAWYSASKLLLLPLLLLLCGYSNLDAFGLM